jgi:DNA invertase Pin-like site-specific DNA recombinase
VQNRPIIYGYAQVSTDGQSGAAQVAALRKHGAGKVFREVASGAKTDRTQLRRVLEALWKALVGAAPSRRLLRHTLLSLALTPSRL